MSFALWDERARRLANALIGLGLRKGDRVAVLAFNCIEWAEIYAATAKAGLVAVPVNFRLIAAEALYVIEDAECAALIVEDQLAGLVEEMGTGLSINEDRRICLRQAQGAGRLSRLRDVPRLRRGCVARSRGRSRRPLGVHVHLRHHRAAEGRHPHASRRDDGRARHRDRA